ncbi:MAG: RidA family protein [Gemmatimonadales bacterium]
MRQPLPAFLPLMLLLAGCRPPSPGAAPDRSGVAYVAMPGRSDLPFSAVVRVGSMLYLSGQLGTDSSGRLAPGGIAPETGQALANREYVRHFPARLTARSAFGASGLALGARVEIECLAAVGRV